MLIDSRTRPDSRSGLLSESASVNCLTELSITESRPFSRSRHPWTRPQGPKAALLNLAAALCRLMHSARRNPWTVSTPPAVLRSFGHEAFSKLALGLAVERDEPKGLQALPQRAPWEHPPQLAVFVQKIDFSKRSCRMEISSLSSHRSLRASSQ